MGTGSQYASLRHLKPSGTERWRVKTVFSWYQVNAIITLNAARAQHCGRHFTGKENSESEFHTGIGRPSGSCVAPYLFIILIKEVVDPSVQLDILMNLE